MCDREKVIRGLECIRDWAQFTVKNGWIVGGASEKMVKYAEDALALLKEQEPVEPILKREGWNKYHNDYVCQICDQELVYEQSYCSECGRAVKWNG